MLLLVAMISASFVVRPGFTRNFGEHPWLLVVPMAAALAAGAIPIAQRARNDLNAFLLGSALIALILGSVAAGLYPQLLPARPGSAHPGLDIYNSASPEGSLRIALGVYLFGITLVGIYLVNIYRVWRGKVRAVYH
jgi:cytochrome d ubiquinol oxidase subunit II